MFFEYWKNLIIGTLCTRSVPLKHCEQIYIYQRSIQGKSQERFPVPEKKFKTKQKKPQHQKTNNNKTKNPQKPQQNRTKQKIPNTKPLPKPSLGCSYGMETISLNAGPTDSVSVPNYYVSVYGIVNKTVISLLRALILHRDK